MHEIRLDHTTDTGHRIVGHKGKCARIHGHTYRWQVKIEAQALNEMGFVADFGDVKAVLDEWDHRLVLWRCDPVALSVGPPILQLGKPATPEQVEALRHEWEQAQVGSKPIILGPDVHMVRPKQEDVGIVRVEFNPTAEHMARDRAEAIAHVCPAPCTVTVQVFETPKCSAIYTHMEAH
jgi:6-pyruvoyl-tetrahydropterin synthase